MKKIIFEINEELDSKIARMKEQTGLCKTSIVKVALYNYLNKSKEDV